MIRTRNLKAEPAAKQRFLTLFRAGESRSAYRKNNTATTLLELGDNEAAAKQLVEAATAAEEALGAEHPTTIEILNNLAQALVNQAKFAEADAALAKVPHACEIKLGPDHLQTAQTRAALGAIRSRLGRLPEAQELYEQALAIFRQTYGPTTRRYCRSWTSWPARVCYSATMRRRARLSPPCWKRCGDNPTPPQPIKCE